MPALAARWELPLLLVLSPALVFPGPWSPYVAVLILGLWGLRARATGRLWPRTPLDWPLLLLLLATLVAYVVSPLPALSASKLWGILLGMAAYVSAVMWVADGGRARTLGWLLAALGAGIALLALVGTDWQAAQLVRVPWLYDPLPQLVRGVPGSGLPTQSAFFNPRQVGGTLALLLPLAAALVRVSSHWWQRGLLLVATGLMGAVLALTQTPSALAGAALGLWLLGVVEARRFRWALLGLAAVGLVGALALGGLGASQLFSFTAADLGGQRHLGFGLVSRLEIWQRGLRMAHDLPYTGIGLNTFPVVMDRFYSGFALGPEPHAHHLFLHTAVDLGLPGLVALVWLLGGAGALVVGIARWQTDPSLRAVAVGSGCGVAAYVVYGQLDTFTLGAKPGLAFWLMLGLIGAAAVREPKVIPETRRATYALHLAALALLAGALVWPLTYAGVSLNAGRLAAHAALLTPSPDSPEQLRQAAPLLEQAAASDPTNSGVWYLLGSVYAELGASESALDVLRRGSMLDIREPLWKYAPAEALAQVAAPQEDPQGLLRVYGQWQARYPTRAEWHLAAALVQCEVLKDRAAALLALNGGMPQVDEQGQRLLRAYQAEIAAGGKC